MSKVMEDLGQKIEQEYAKYQQSITKPNILVIGATGVGKSSLINTIFGEDLARTGTGKPVTQELNVYQSDKVPVCLYDTVGYEIGTQKQREFLDNVVQYAIDSNDKKVEDRIHLVWYCIGASGHRVHTVDIDVINRLNEEQIPVAIVFTKSDLISDEESQSLKQTVIQAKLNNDMFETTNEKLEDLGYMDTEKLIDWSIEKLPEGLKRAFISAQKVNLEHKREEAKKIILQHTGSAAVVGMSPIPFSDGPILLANQAGMFARILFVYDMGSLLPQLKNLIGSVGIGALISSSGAWLVGQLLKFIPGAGTVGGALISGSVASAITSAIGLGISEICYRLNSYVLDNDMEGLEGFFQNIEEFFKSFVIDAFKNAKSGRNTNA